MKRPASYKKTLVRKGATIGADATVIRGHTLGKFCFIGAGTVVTKDVPDYGLVVGNPGRLKGHVCYCGDNVGIDISDHKVDLCECESCGP